MASIRHKKGKARHTRPKHCKVCSSTTPLKLGLILSENALVTVSFWGHYHGQAAAQQKDSTMFYIWKDNSQHLLFSVLCTQGENTIFYDLNAHRRCEVLYMGCLLFVQRRSMSHVARQQDPGKCSRADLCHQCSQQRTVTHLPLTDSLLSRLLPWTQHLHLSFFSSPFPWLTNTRSSLISIQQKSGRCDLFGWHSLYL